MVFNPWEISERVAVAIDLQPLFENAVNRTEPADDEEAAQAADDFDGRVVAHDAPLVEADMEDEPAPADDFDGRVVPHDEPVPPTGANNHGRPEPSGSVEWEVQSSGHSFDVCPAQVQPPVPPIAANDHGRPEQFGSVEREVQSSGHSFDVRPAQVEPRGHEGGSHSEASSPVAPAVADEGLTMGADSRTVPHVAVESAAAPLGRTQSKSKLTKSPKDHAQRTERHKREKRAAKRKAAQEAAGTSLKLIARRRAMDSQAIRANAYQIENAPHTSTGYIGKWGGAQRRLGGVQSNSESSIQLQQLKSAGFKYIPWDGTGIYVVDSAKRAVVGGGTPHDRASWGAVVEGSVAAMIRARNVCSFTDKQLFHRRGTFPALAAGFSYGMGQTRPTTTAQTPDNKASVQELLSDPNIGRIAGFQSSLLHAYAPRLWEYYDRTMAAITSSQDEIRRNFVNSVFASITFNFGPRTVTVPHIDYLNLAGGLCAITALGNFNPDLGGHLILWDLRIVLRFPPGATILIPSSLLRHSNVPIQASEQRFSITQYTAGGIFRWVENGLSSDAHRGGKGKEPERQWQNTMDLFEKR